ncbi:hypothetical protein BH18ACT9_BH18ACT9_12580 [soil metagenome]
MDNGLATEPRFAIMVDVTTTRTRIALLAAAALALCSCSWAGPGEVETAPKEESQRASSLDPAVSMTDAGVDLVSSAGFASEPPGFDVIGEVDPASGAVHGTVKATLPVTSEASELYLRYFAGLPDFEANAQIGTVGIDGTPADATLDKSIITIPLAQGHPDVVDVVVPFSYTLQPAEPAGLLDALGGMGGPSDVGLLALHKDVVNLGHWFPIWVPPGNNVDPDPAGFGDIGNYPAAAIRLELTVPRGWTVVDGGVRTGEHQDDSSLTVRSEGFGMNDMVVSLLRGYTSKSRTLTGELDEVTVTAYAPSSAKGELAGVLKETARSLETLSRVFVDYPWREFDVVAAPLGSGVGGMEWPGATWIEAGLFAGGLPGKGGLQDLLGDSEDLAGLLGEDLGSLGDLGGLSGGEAGQMLQTLRLWTIAHEVGHEWWHVVVGNDSVLDPVVDEPLAQHSACLVLRDQMGPQATNQLCATHIEAAYQQMRLLGDADGPAARTTDDFDSSAQYAGVVYGKAAAFYPALEARFGPDVVTTALGAITRNHAFRMLTSDDLREALGEELGDPIALDRIWHRWMEAARGDEDLGKDDRGVTGLEGLEGLNGLDLEQLLAGSGQDPKELEELLDQLLGGLEQRR